MATHTYQLVANYNVGGQFASNIFHWSFDDGGYSTTVQAAAALNSAFDVNFRTLLKNCLSAQVTLLSYKSRALNVTGGFEGIFLVPAGQVGARAGNLMASGCGPVIVWYPIDSLTLRPTPSRPRCGYRTSLYRVGR